MTDMRKYTVVRSRMSDHKYEVALKVGAQEFSVTPIPFDNRQEAELMREQLCVALERIVRERRGDPT